MASGGGEQLPFRKAWSGVQIEIRHFSKKVEKYITKRDLVCKLQFFLLDEIMRKSLLFKMKRRNIIVTVQEINKDGVYVIVDLQEQMNSSDVINAFEHALEGQITKRVKFENEEKLCRSFDSLDEDSKEFLYNGTVGLFLDKSTDGESLNIIGSKADVEIVENMLRNEDGRMEPQSSVYETGLLRIDYDKERNMYVYHYVFGEDTTEYLHLVNFKEQLSEHCRNVNIVEIHDGKTDFLIEGTIKHDIMDANDYLMEFVNTVVRKSICASSVALTFLQAQSVVLHCKEKLKQVPAYMQVSTDIVVWAPTEENLEKAEKKLFDCFCDNIVNGNVEITEEIREIIENSDCKIQLIKISDHESNVESEAVYHVVYLKEMSDEAQRMIDCLQYNLKCKGFQKSVQYEEHVIRYFMASRLWKEIIRPFPSVKIDFSIQSLSVTISAELKSDTESALREFDVYAKKIEKVEISGLSEGFKELLLREHISCYVSKKLKYHYLLFMAEDEKFVCVGEKLGDGEKLKEEIKRKCILSRSMVKDFLQMDIGRELLKKYAERIVVEKQKEETGNKNVSHICYTNDLHEELDSLVKDCSEYNYYKKKCNPATSEFLQIPNLSIVGQVEKDFDVKIGFENGYIVFRGNYENGERASKELEKNIPNDDLILSNGERFKSLLESEEGKKKLNEITREKNCCWSMTCQLEGKAEKVHKIMMTGITHLISWIPLDTRSTVSLVEADFTTAEFDVLVVLVDDKLCGENIMKTDDSFHDYDTMMKMKAKKPLDLGAWRKVDICKGFASKTLVLIPSFRKKNSKKNRSRVSISDQAFQKVIAEVFESNLTKENIKVGFAMPTFNEMFLKNMVAGFMRAVNSKYQANQQAHIYICAQQEVKSIMKDVDGVIKKVCGAKQTRRIVSDTIKGMFKRPSTSVQVEKASIFDVRAQCLVVLTAKDLDLTQGTLSNKVLENGGNNLQKEIKSKSPEKSLKKGEIITTGPGKLKTKGVKVLMFGHLPKWINNKERLQVLEKFVVDCIMKADEYNCGSIAFPALGTGNLHYPPRDVAAAMLDGIESYIEETMSGAVDTVCITTTNDQMHQILTKEQQIRDEQKDRGVGDAPDDAEILISNDSRIYYTVVKESQLQMNPSGKAVQVKFLPKEEVGNINCPNHWQLLIGCGTTENDLKMAVIQMMKQCEEIMLITSIHVYCSKELPFSFADQSKIIIDTVYNKMSAVPVDRYPNRVYNYLSNVTIVVEDEAGFSNIEADLLQQGNWFTSWFGAKRIWRKGKQTKRQCSIRIKLIGEQEEDIKSVKAAIESYLFSINNWQHSDELEKHKLEETTEHLKPGKPVTEKQTEAPSQTKADNQTVAITENQHQQAQNESTESDVCAELNQGIVKYLQSRKGGYFTWLKQVEDEFGVHITEAREDNGELQMYVAGSFESILRFEQNLEEKFPNENQSNEMETDASLFPLQDGQIAVEIPITEDEKSNLVMFYAEEIKDLSDKGILIALMTQSEYRITLICQKNYEEKVKTQFYSFKENLSKIRVKKLVFPSLAVMQKIETTCLNQCSKGIKYVKDEVRMQIKIMGMNPESLVDLEKTVSRVAAEAYEEKENIEKSYTIGKLNVCIYNKDILQTNVDCIVSSGGVAKYIAESAGKKYKDKFEKSMRSKELHLCECRTTEPGDLRTLNKLKKVIHVNCSFSAENYTQWKGLQLIQKSVQNCLNEADRQGMNSIALPFICSGGSGYDIEECAKQYIRAMSITSHKLKKVRTVHLVDKFPSSVKEVCKVFDAYLEIQGLNPEGLLPFGEQSKFSIGNTTVKLCQGNIKLSVAQGIAIFVDNHSQQSSSKVLKSLEVLYEGDTFKEMLKNARTDDGILLFPANNSMMCDIVLATCLDMVDENQMEKDMYHAVKIVLKRASEIGLVSFALSLPETMKGNSITRYYLERFSHGIIDFFCNGDHEISLKYVVIVGSEYRKIEYVSKDLEKFVNSKQDKQRVTFRSHHGSVYYSMKMRP